MNDWEARRARYQRDDLSIQLGGLASNLSRIAWCAERANQQQAMPVLRESKDFTPLLPGSPSLQAGEEWAVMNGSSLEKPRPLGRGVTGFTEWAAPSCVVEQQGMLAELQLNLAVWERQWGSRVSPSDIAQAARQWSERLLEAAGVLKS